MYINNTIFSDIFLHERFFAGSLHNDLALLRLAVSLDWEEAPQVSPACLPEPQQLPEPGTRCWVTGWGQVNTGLSLVNTYHVT